MPKKLPSFITQDEFEKIVEYAKGLEKKAGSKRKKERLREYRLAMLLGFEAGMRISEIVGFGKKVPRLTPSKVDNAFIKISSGKGGKDRIVPRPKRMNKTAIAMLPLKIRRRSLQDFVVKCGKDALNKKINFHMLRHGFGSHLAGKGTPLHEIQMLMGHSRLDTTGIYLHANPKKAVDSARESF